MGRQLEFAQLDFEARAVSPFLEMGAYEALWCQSGTTFKSLANKFARRPGSFPTDFVSTEEAQGYASFVGMRFQEANIKFGVRIHGTGEYPSKLRDAANPLEFLYYQGWWDLVASRSVAVVGTRQPSPEGLLRTKRLVRNLVEDEFTIVSGLAAGIDRMAHETAMEENGRTIAVIGTPLCHSYPKQNAGLQQRIAEEFLVVSQVPVKRYENQDHSFNRSFFPERNITMSALTEATIIVEAGETSGTLGQGRAAIRQNRRLFILDSCFQDQRLTWPTNLEAKGAIRVKDYNDIQRVLSESPA